MATPRYMKKPKVVKAIRFDDDIPGEIALSDMFGQMVLCTHAPHGRFQERYKVDGGIGAGGVLTADVGDYIVKDDYGFRVETKKDFESNYIPVWDGSE